MCRPRHVHRRYVLAGATHKAPRPLAAADAVRQVQVLTKLQYMQLQYLWASTTQPTSGQRRACSSSRNFHRAVDISHSLRLNIFRAATAHIKTHPQQSIHRHAARGIAQIPGICRRTLRTRLSDIGHRTPPLAQTDTPGRRDRACSLSLAVSGCAAAGAVRVRSGRGCPGRFSRHL
jgi:hypothetical protein